MNTYQISYDDRHDGITQSVDVRIKAMGYTTDGNMFTLFNTSISGAKIPIASFMNWNSITDMSVVQE